MNGLIYIKGETLRVDPDFLRHQCLEKSGCYVRGSFHNKEQKQQQSQSDNFRRRKSLFWLSVAAVTLALTLSLWFKIKPLVP